MAVPSRLKASKSERVPLGGMRVAVKDLFHLKGVHTGCGNRAYRSLSTVSEVSSNAVRSVIDLGAVIVGKTKTVEFGGSQEVIGDWSDYFYPLNARGDGYIAATGSSTGSASSLTAYPWLDITLGTDGKVIPARKQHLANTNTDWLPQLVEASETQPSPTESTDFGPHTTVNQLPMWSFLAGTHSDRPP